MAQLFILRIITELRLNPEPCPLSSVPSPQQAHWCMTVSQALSPEQSGRWACALVVVLFRALQTLDQRRRGRNKAREGSQSSIPRKPRPGLGPHHNLLSGFKHLTLLRGWDPERYFWLLFCSAGNWNQGLAHARQVFYHCSSSPALQDNLVYFKRRPHRVTCPIMTFQLMTGNIIQRWYKQL